MELKDLKLINNGGIPELEQRLEDKVASTAIPLGATSGKSTLADRKAIHNLPKFEYGKPLMTTLQIMQANSQPLKLNTSISPTLSGGTLSNGTTYNPLQTRINTNDPSKFFGLKIGLSNPSQPNPGKSVGGSINRGASALGTAASIGSAVASNLGGAIDFVGGIASAGDFNMTADDALKDAGTSSGSIGGVGYTRLNDVDSAQISAQTSAENSANTVGLMGKGASLGASVGSVAGPVGGLIGGAVGAIGGLVGGLLGGAARKRKMRRMIAEAKDKAFRQNDFSRSGALTSAMQQQYAQEFGDTESQSLYGFAEGLAQTPFGFASGKLTNAYGSNGEFAVQRDPLGNVIAATKLGHGRDNKDTVPIVVDDKTEIYTNKKVEIAPGIKVRPSEYFENTGDANGANYMTAMNIQKKKGYKCGKLPKFAWGLPEWVNFAGNAYGYLAADSEKRKIDAEEISKPDTYQANPNAAKGLYILGLQQENPYAIIPELYNEYAKGMYAISNAGGLSGGQRALARLSALNNLTAQSAKLQQAAQAANIAHRQTYADAMLRYGAADAQNRMAAMQHDYNAYNQAHGAKRAMSSKLLGNKVGYGLNFAKGVSDLSMWRDMKNMWDAEFKAEHPESTDGGSTSGTTTASVPTTSTVPTTGSTEYLNGAYGSYSNPYTYKAPDWFKGYTPGQDYSYKMNFGDVPTLTAPTGYKPAPTAATTPQVSGENFYGGNTAYQKMLATRNADALSHPTYSDNGGFSSYAAEKMGNYPTTKENNTTVKTKSAAKVDKKTQKAKSKKVPDSFKMPNTRGAAYYKDAFGDDARQRYYDLMQWAADPKNFKSK